MAVKKNVVEVEKNVVEEESNVVEMANIEIQEEELLFPGGPSVKQIDAWKEKYGQIYMTEIDEEDAFIWRVLNRREFKEIMKLDDADAMYREERVCEKCILWPEGRTFTDMSEGKAGAPTVLAEQVMEKSGFSPKIVAIAL